jgi:hypothetical protein
MDLRFSKVILGLLILSTCLVMIVSCPIKDNSETTVPNETADNKENLTNKGSSVKYEMPDRLVKSMDFPAEYTIIELTESQQSAHVVYTVNPPKTQEIAQLHLTDLQTRGYTSGDNPSRILEGIEFTGGEWRKIYVKVSEEADKGTVVTIDVDY